MYSMYQESLGCQFCHEQCKFFHHNALISKFVDWENIVFLVAYWGYCENKIKHFKDYNILQNKLSTTIISFHHFICFMSMPTGYPISVSDQCLKANKSNTFYFPSKKGISLFSPLMASILPVTQARHLGRIFIFSPLSDPPHANQLSNHLTAY